MKKTILLLLIILNFLILVNFSNGNKELKNAKIIQNNTNYYPNNDNILNFIKIIPVNNQNEITNSYIKKHNKTKNKHVGQISPKRSHKIFKNLEVNTFYLKVSRDTLYYSPEKTRDTIKIKSNTNWKIINNYDWIEINPIEGKNNATIYINISNNPISRDRSAILIVKSPEIRDSLLINIKQNSRKCRKEDENPCYQKNYKEINIPSFNELETNTFLPDPFKFLNGKKVSTKEEWNHRKMEIALLVQEFELGYKPCTPYNATTGKFKDNKITVIVNENEKIISFDCQIFYPTKGTPPYPAMIGIGFCLLDRQTLFNNGVAIINLPVDEIAEQRNTESRGKGKFYDLYCSDHSAGALMAWAWSVSRLIDALEKTPEANIDVSKLGVTGCSRYGKGALIAGAFDERISLTIPQESGSGGAASWRVSDYQKYELKQNVQTLSQIVTENCWFRSNFSQFSGNTNLLPIDHHLLAGLCAPRALLIIENTAMEWLGNFSTFINAKAARMIWEALGEIDKFGFSQYGHGDHCRFKEEQLPELDAFIKKFLVKNDQNINTTIFKTDGNFTFDSIRWINWSIPSLR